MTQKPGGFSKAPAGGNVPDSGAVLDTPVGPATLTHMDDVPDSVKQAALGEDTVEVPESGAGSLAKELDKEQMALDKFCPLCGWDTNNKEIVEVDDEDKRNFVIAVLGNKRFSKTYSRLGGMLKITMRNRTSEETEAVSKQLAADQVNENIEAASLLYLRSLHYQMIIGLEALQVGDEALQTFPEVSTEFPAVPKVEEGELPPEPEPTPLEVASKTLKAGPLKSEVTYTIVQNVSRHFEQVIQHLTMQAHNPDFWEGIATPR